MRTCQSCSGPIPADAHKNRRYCDSKCRSSAEYSRDGEKKKARQRDYYAGKVYNPPYFRDAALRRNYGITSQEWEAMFESQGRKCYFGCADPGSTRGRGWQTDHDHETGKVRAILCWPHNRAIGFIETNSEQLSDLLLYIESFKVSNQSILT